MEQSVEAIDRAIEDGATTRRELPRPIPVFVIYQTAFTDDNGAPQFRPDFYSRDARIWQQMQKPSSTSRPNPNS